MNPSANTFFREISVHKDGIFYAEEFLNSPLPDYDFVVSHPEPEHFAAFFYRWGGEGKLLALLGELWFAAYLRCRIDEASDQEQDYFFRQAGEFLFELRKIPTDKIQAPAAAAYWTEAVNTIPQNAGEIREWIIKSDPASPGGVLKLQSGKMVPAKLEELHKPEDFFSFYGVRKAFADAMRDFAAGRGNVPLLIYSLPGHGKTQFTLSYAAAEKSLSILLPPPSALTRDLEQLLHDLKRRRGRRFVVFFDDIDPEAIDWFEFKNLVGGIYSPPENVLLCISSNYQFPPSVVSRGRLIEFPMFDEIRCGEMVEDFLISCNMRKPPANLVSLIAADYTESFGQKEFSELSPRTLSRYLQKYKTDINLRKRMLELSTGEMITRPDAQLFYDFNIKILRSLYGQEYIENLKQQRLRELER